MYQSTPFNLMGLPVESVNVIRISDITVFETGLNKALFGSKLNGKLLVRLVCWYHSYSVAITTVSYSICYDITIDLNNIDTIGDIGEFRAITCVC